MTDPTWWRPHRWFRIAVFGLVPLPGYTQQPLYYCASCGGHYPIGHFCA